VFHKKDCFTISYVLSILTKDPLTVSYKLFRFKSLVWKLYKITWPNSTSTPLFVGAKMYFHHIRLTCVSIETNESYGYLQWVKHVL